MNRITFKSKSMMKNFKRALKASHHIQQGELIYFTTGSNMPLFKRNETVHNYIDAIVSEMMQNQIIQNNFSQDELKKDVILILGYLDENNALNMSKKDFTAIYNQLITKLENKINKIIETEFDEFECIFHILPDLEGDVDCNVVSLHKRILTIGVACRGFRVLQLHRRECEQVIAGKHNAKGTDTDFAECLVIIEGIAEACALETDVRGVNCPEI